MILNHLNKNFAFGYMTSLILANGETRSNQYLSQRLSIAIGYNVGMPQASWELLLSRLLFTIFFSFIFIIKPVSFFLFISSCSELCYVSSYLYVHINFKISIGRFFLYLLLAQGL